MGDGRPLSVAAQRHKKPMKGKGFSFFFNVE